MSFINSNTTTVIRAKLTDTGRKLLAQGNLTYDFWTFGDSEIDYGFNSINYDLSDNKVLAPKDKNYNIKYPLAAVTGGNIFNSLNNGLPIESVIVNKATTRGFFNSGTTMNTSLLKGSGNILSSNIEGGNTIALSISSGSISQGDIIVLGVKNESQTGSLSNNVTVAMPYLTYKVKSTNGASGAVNVVVDRMLPYINTGVSSSSVWVIDGGDAINNFYGSGTTTAYWNYNTLSMENNCNCIPNDVPVWNFNIIYTENLVGVNTAIYQGIDTYLSNVYNGFKEYINDTSFDNTKKAIGIVHYTNNTISNFYGENFSPQSFVLSLPTVLWHKQGIQSGTGAQIGITLSGQTQTNVLTTDSNAFGTTAIPFSATYDNLVDQSGNIVGKVFNTLKMAVIEDEELLAAMSYKSNRNWSLPTLDGNFISAVTEGQGLIGTNEEVYVTYVLVNDEGAGYGTGLPCQTYRKINRGGVGQNNIKVSFPANQLPFLKPTFTTSGGFNANKLVLLLQKVTVGQRPVSSSWKAIDVTSQLTLNNGRLDSQNLESMSFNIDLATYSSASNFDLNNYIVLPTLADTDILSFGEEVVLLGNIDTDITATTYKSSFIFPALSNQFKSSVNPTFNTNNNDAVYISEVGIYNTLKQLVAIGKLSNPIKKLPTSNILVQLEIDF